MPPRLSREPCEVLARSLWIGRCTAARRASSASNQRTVTHHAAAGGVGRGPRSRHAFPETSAERRGKAAADTPRRASSTDATGAGPARARRSRRGVGTATTRARCRTRVPHRRDPDPQARERPRAIDTRTSTAASSTRASASSDRCGKQSFSVRATRSAARRRSARRAPERDLGDAVAVSTPAATGRPSHVREPVEQLRPLTQRSFQNARHQKQQHREPNGETISRVRAERRARIPSR